IRTSKFDQHGQLSTGGHLERRPIIVPAAVVAGAVEIAVATQHQPWLAKPAPAIYSVKVGQRLQNTIGRHLEDRSKTVPTPGRSRAIQVAVGILPQPGNGVPLVCLKTIECLRLPRLRRYGYQNQHPQNTVNRYA